MTPLPTDPHDDAQQPDTEPQWLTRRDDSELPTKRSQDEHPRASLFSHPVVHHAHKQLRRVFLVVGFILALVALGLIVTAISLRHAMRASLAQTDGTLHAPGLTLPVTVTRDPQGVPSINAATIDDALFAQGFVTAQDRLWQMDALRRHASGNLAELLGPSMVAHDRLQRTLQIGAAADRATANLPPDQLRQLQTYARGVNAFMQQATKSSQLSAEFHLLHYTPAPWTPRDSILVYLAMVQDLSTGFPVKLRREALAQHLPPQLLNDLYPVGSWRDRPPTQPQPDLTTPVPAVEQIPLDRSQSLLATPDDLLHLAQQLPASQCTECRTGSNNWAVAGIHTASGQPLVSNDMHLSLNVPAIWYEAALHAPATSTTAALDVSGFTLPGVPYVIVGRNAHVAWGFTNLIGDVQDVRVEHTRGTGNKLEYQHLDGTWSPVNHHTEKIIVRGGRNITLDVLTTTERLGASTSSARAAGVQQIETPIITPLLPSEHRTLSLAWTIYDPSTVTAPFLAVDMANDGASLVAALSNFGAPSLSLAYADDHNHIGFHAIGAIPIRGTSAPRPRTLAPTIAVGPAPADEEDELNTSDESSTPAQAATPPAANPSQGPAPTYLIGSEISPTPVDALDASQTWSGYIPYSQLPNVVDPPSGIVATANSRVTPDNYPYAIALNWAPPYRAERIYKLLTNRDHLTPADMLAVQNDVHSEFDLAFAQRLSYAIDHASPAALARDARRLHQASDILRAWTGDVSINDVAPSLVAATREQLLPMLLVQQIAAHDKRTAQSKHAQSAGNPAEIAALYNWASETVAIEDMLQHTPARWLPPAYANWNDLLTAALVRALQNAPGNLSTWQYGSQHAISIDHPVFGITPILDILLGTHSGTGAHPTGGNGVTIRVNAPHYGPSERFTADLANPQATTANITTGQSANPKSPHYLDQFLPWLSGTTFPLPLANPTATHTLTLLP